LNFPDFTSEWVLGRTNGALNFNAAGGPVNEYVEIPDAVSLNFDTVSNFTLAAWVRGPVTQISGAGIITKGFGSLNEQYTLDVFGGFLSILCPERRLNRFSSAHRKSRPTGTGSISSPPMMAPSPP